MKNIILLIFAINFTYAASLNEGYINKSVDMKLLVGAPPNIDSLSFINDKAISEPVYSLDIDSDEIKRAIESSDDSIENIMLSFSDAFGQRLSAEETPAIFNIVSRAIYDANKSKNIVKNYYKRQRPYLFFNKAPCVAQEYNVRGNSVYSYPSGHAIRAWTIALILSSLNNNQSIELLNKAKSIGQDRVICGVHWQSDVDASVIIAIADFTMEQSNKEYQSDLDLARKEVNYAK